jgi:hypothetical protein
LVYQGCYFYFLYALRSPNRRSTLSALRSTLTYGCCPCHDVLGCSICRCATCSPGPRSGCGGRCRRGTLHADSPCNCDWRPEATQEGRAVEGDRRGGADSAQYTATLDTEEGVSGEVHPATPHAADAYAAHQPAKRRWTSASLDDANTTS